MKTFIHGLLVWIVLSALSFFLLFGGCKESPSSEGTTEGTPIEVEGIIINPKAPEPKDTVSLAAVVTSSSQNVGDFPTYSWEVSGGVLIENGKSSVHWEAPETSGVYEISVTVTNSLSSDHRTEAVFVTSITKLVNGSAGEVSLVPGADAFYFLRSSISPSDPSFVGFTISKYDQGAVSQVTTSLPGLGYEFSRNMGFAVHSHEETEGYYTEYPINLILTTLPSGSQTPITVDGAAFTNARRYQFTEPEISPDDQLIAYSGTRFSNLVEGGVDTFDVYVYNVGTSETHRITTSFNNFYPSFSSDGGMLTFISDRDTIAGWEVFAYPVSGGVVDTVGAPIQLSRTGGLITSSFPPTKPLSAWNPQTPYLALLCSDNRLRFINTTGSGNAPVIRGMTGTVKALSWSSDGSMLAVSTGSYLYSVDMTRNVQLLHTSDNNSDVINDITWSENNEFILYNIKRYSNTWFEVVDVSDSFDIPDGLRVTSTVPVRTREQYRSLMSLSPLWKSNEEIFAPVFDAITPSIVKMDFSGLFD